MDSKLQPLKPKAHSYREYARPAFRCRGHSSPGMGTVLRTPSFMECRAQECLYSFLRCGRCQKVLQRKCDSRCACDFTNRSSICRSVAYTGARYRVRTPARIPASSAWSAAPAGSGYAKRCGRGVTPTVSRYTGLLEAYSFSIGDSTWSHANPCRNEKCYSEMLRWLSVDTKALTGRRDRPA